MTAKEMAACGWLYGMKVLTAEDVKRLPVGYWVSLIGPDRHGEKNVEEGIVIQSGKVRKFRIDRHDGFHLAVIRDYPGKVWTVREGAVGG